MSSLFSIIRGDEILEAVASPDRIAPVLEGRTPGRYVIEESNMAYEFLPSGYSCQRWGVVLHLPDGSVILEPEPTPKGSHRNP